MAILIQILTWLTTITLQTTTITAPIGYYNAYNITRNAITIEKNIERNEFEKLQFIKQLTKHSIIYKEYYAKKGLFWH